MKQQLITRALVLAGFVVALGMLLSRWIPDVAIERLSQSLDLNLSAGYARFNFPSAVMMRDVSLKQARQIGAVKEVALVNSIEMDLNPGIFLSGGIHVRNLTLNEPKIFVGSDDWARVFKAPRFEKINIHNGSLNLADHVLAKGGGAVQLSQIDAVISTHQVKGGDRRVEWRFSGKVHTGRERAAAVLRSDGWYSVINRKWQANINVDRLWLPYFNLYCKNIAKAGLRDGLMTIAAQVSGDPAGQKIFSRAELAHLAIDADRSELFLGVDREGMEKIIGQTDNRILLDIQFDWLNASTVQERADAVRAALEKSLRDKFYQIIQSKLDNAIENVGAGAPDEETETLLFDSSVGSEP